MKVRRVRTGVRKTPKARFLTVASCPVYPGEDLARFLKSIVQAVERAFEESGLSQTDLDAVMEEWEKQSDARRKAMEREHRERFGR